MWGNYGGVPEGEDVREYDNYTLGYSKNKKAVWVIIERLNGFAWMFTIPISTMKEYKFVEVRPKQFNTRNRGLRWVKEKVYIHMESKLYHENTFGRIERWKKNNS